MTHSWILRLIWLGVLVLCISSIFQLERERLTVDERTVNTPLGDVSIFQAAETSRAPVVFIAHGFAGSRQMMQYLSRGLARSGYTVAAFDFFGHGRHQTPMSPDVTRIEGTTQQLVNQTLGIVDHLRDQIDLSEGVALLGHSMATDIVIRAAQDIPEVEAVVAISMYSDAVSATFPQRLLILSGEWEGRLREVGREAVAMVADSENGVEGITVEAGGVERRAVYVPRTEHVAVLFSTTTLSEAEQWLNGAFDRTTVAYPKPMGGWIVALLFSLVALAWPLRKILPKTPDAAKKIGLKPYFATLFAPVLPAVLAASIVPTAFFGLAGFGALLTFFAVWGAVALAVLAYAGQSFQRPSWLATFLFLVWALGVFSLALDRFGAAFLPTGARQPLMAALCVGTIPFLMADRLLVAGQSIWLRFLARVVPLAALSACMTFSAKNLGLLFTVLPVMVLFFLAFGIMGRAVAKQSGSVTAAVGLGIALAWSIAASTPLFAVSAQPF